MVQITNFYLKYFSFLLFFYGILFNMAPQQFIQLFFATELKFGKVQSTSSVAFLTNRKDTIRTNCKVGSDAN